MRTYVYIIYEHEFKVSFNRTILLLTRPPLSLHHGSRRELPRRDLMAASADGRRQAVIRVSMVPTLFLVLYGLDLLVDDVTDPGSEVEEGHSQQQADVPLTIKC